MGKKRLTLYSGATVLLSALMAAAPPVGIRAASKTSAQNNVVAEEYHRDFTEELPRATLINKDGIDVTGKVSSFQNESPVLDRHGGHGKNDGEDLPQGQASDRCGGDGASALIAGSDVLQ